VVDVKGWLHVCVKVIWCAAAFNQTHACKATQIKCQLLSFAGEIEIQPRNTRSANIDFGFSAAKLQTELILEQNIFVFCGTKNPGCK